MSWLLILAPQYQHRGYGVCTLARIVYITIINAVPSASDDFKRGLIEKAPQGRTMKDKHYQGSQDPNRPFDDTGC